MFDGFLPPRVLLGFDALFSALAPKGAGGWLSGIVCGCGVAS